MQPNFSIHVAIMVYLKKKNENPTFVVEGPIISEVYFIQNLIAQFVKDSQSFTSLSIFSTIPIQE